jgi:hypothetical protein
MDGGYRARSNPAPNNAPRARVRPYGALFALGNAVLISTVPLRSAA